jgi:PKHD-type hydroxylase
MRCGNDDAHEAVMIRTLSNVLSPEETLRLRDGLAGVTWSSGTTTAGWLARQVKNNEQAEGDGVQALLDQLKFALSFHAGFRRAARPKQLVSPMFSRYLPGMSYGEHVDDALMSHVRTDLSFTLFLSEPSSYDGGELELCEPEGWRSVKLEAGALVLYPTAYLHRVAPITRGERLAAVGWVRSYIRSDVKREVLGELDALIDALREREVPAEIIRRAMLVETNLKRMWIDD